MPTKKPAVSLKAIRKAVKAVPTIPADGFNHGPGKIASTDAASYLQPPHTGGCRCSLCEQVYVRVGLEAMKWGGLPSMIEHLDSGKRKNANLLHEVEGLRQSQQASAAEVRRLKRCLASERSRHKATKVKLELEVDHVAFEQRNVAKIQQQLTKEKDEWRGEMRILANENAQLQQAAAADAIERQRQIDLLGSVEADRDARLAEVEQLRASAQRALNECHADLATVRAGRERERQDYVDARKTFDSRIRMIERDQDTVNRECARLRQASVLAEIFADNAGVQIAALRGELRLSEAHLDNVREEMADRGEALTTLRADYERLLNGYDRRRRELDDWYIYSLCLVQLIALRESTIHRQLTESLEIWRNFPEIARTLRAVRAMLFPPHGLLPAAPQT